MMLSIENVSVVAIALLLSLRICDAAFSTSKQPPNSIRLLAKTQESFKFADLLLLYAELEAKEGDSVYKCKRLVLDGATGSNLLWLEMDEFAPTKHASSFLSRCEWIVETLATGETAEDLVKAIEEQGGIELPNCTAGWSLDYVRMNPLDENCELQYTLKTMLCSVAPLIRARPVLNRAEASDELLLIETVHEGIYLGHIKWRGPQITWSPPQIWTQRPFQYSSAIHPALAEIVVEMVLGLMRDRPSSTNSEIHFLDPACGSGTFLAFALAAHENIFVHGWDIKPPCIHGTRKNLLIAFGDDAVERKCQLLVRDSSLMASSVQKPIMDCVVANLPWGENTVDYIDENLKILKAIIPQMKAGSPCVFIHKDEKLSNHKTMNSMGYQILGEANIPPLNFYLPKSGRKGKRQKTESGIEENSDKRLKVTVARTTT